MLPRVREFYGLEKLWEDVTPPAEEAAGAAPRPKVAKAGKVAKVARAKSKSTSRARAAR
jgi:hypothetical protein